jgi:hypothetical protein
MRLVHGSILWDEVQIGAYQPIKNESPNWHYRRELPVSH